MDKYYHTACPKAALIKFMKWDKDNLEKLEEFIKNYEAKFEYETGGNWIIRYNRTYKTLNYGDIIIIGYRSLVVTSGSKFNEEYQVMA